MKSQDFEAYADLKKFNNYIASTLDAAFTEAIERAEKIPNEIKLLDYGCGDGKYFKYWLDRGLLSDNIYGFEVSKKRVERCHEIGWDNATLIKQGESLPFMNSSFDIIIMMEVIEHIPAAEGARILRDLRRILRPSGILLFFTPNYPIKRLYDLSDAILHHMYDRFKDDPTHVTRYTNKTLLALLSQSFSRIYPRPFKLGYLYRRIPHPLLLHKLFFLCHA